MKTFEYRGFDQTGRAAHGLVEALDRRRAREQLAARGILTERISAAGGKSRSRRMGMAARDIFYHELGTLLKAGLPLTRALDVMIESPEMGRQAHFLAVVRDAIKEGAPLGTALATANIDASQFELSAIEAGEQSGALAQVCLRIGDFFKRRHRVLESLRTALIYPLIVLVLAFLVASGMLGIMLRRFEQIWIEAGIELPAITKAVIMIGKHGVYLLPLLLLGGFLLVIALRRRNRQSEQFRLRWQRKLFHIPILGRLYTTLANLRFSSTLALLLGGGVQLAEAAEIAGRATGNAWLQKAVENECRAIRHGSSLSQAVSRIPPLAGSLPGWIRAGEESGELAQMMADADERFEQQFEQLLQRSLRIVEPLLLLIVGAIVFVIALAILLPVLSLNQGI